MWIAENPDINATGFFRVAGDKRVELQLEPLSFVVMTEEEAGSWKMVPKFMEAVREGRVLLYETDTMPDIVPEIPQRMRPDRADDYGTAQQIVWCDSKLHRISLENINAYRAEAGAGKDWVDEVNASYLRTRHKQILNASIWLFENVASKMRSGLNTEQKERFAACKRQLKLIEKMV